MFHNIDIGNNVAKTYVSEAFDCMSYIGNGSYSTIRHWHGHEGFTVSVLIKQSLEKMIKIGIKRHVDKHNNYNRPLTNYEFICAYRNDLERLLILAKLYPRQLWKSSQLNQTISKTQLKKIGFLLFDPAHRQAVPQQAAYQATATTSYITLVQHNMEMKSTQSHITQLYKMVELLNNRVGHLTTRLDMLSFNK